LRENLPFAPDEVLQYVTDFLQQAHAADESYTVRDGINIARYVLKLARETGSSHRVLFQPAVLGVLGAEAQRYGFRR
jgi:MoxR-like ATPase